MEHSQGAAREDNGDDPASKFPSGPQSASPLPASSLASPAAPSRGQQEPLSLNDEIMAAIQKGSFHEVITQLDALNEFKDLLTDDDTVVRRERFQADVQQLRKRIRDARRGLLNPRSRYVQWWDLTTALALGYTAFVTPFEVGLGLETSINALFAVNQLVNLVFIIDVLVQFVMPVPDPVTGELIRSHAVLARKYLRGWFGVDVLSVLPIDVVVVAAPKLIPSEDTSFLRALKLLRIMRLFKLVRVLRASRIIQRWESSISMSTSSRSILSAWVGFIICLHWFAWCDCPSRVSFRTTPHATT